MNEIEEWKYYMEIAEKKHDILWKFHQEKKEAQKDTKEDWDKKIQDAIFPLRRSNQVKNLHFIKPIKKLY